MTPLPGPHSDDRAFHTARMEVISFARLVQHDPGERAKLLAAAENDGFFYLDISDKESEDLWGAYEKCLALVAPWFERSTEEKMRFAYNSDIHGYKALGAQAGSLEDHRDGFETLRMCTNAGVAAAQPQQPLPEAIGDYYESTVAPFIRRARSHVHAVLSALSDAHHRTGAARYEACHDPSVASDSSVSVHRYPRRGTISAANVGHNKHTDGGTLTLLFTAQWGLQVLEDKHWAWVRPRPGWAICNVGDALRFMSGRTLRSVVHRVVPSADQEHGHRYSVGWFCRPAHGTVLQDSEGRTIRSDEWFRQKLDIMRATHSVQRANNSLLTGGMENRESPAGCGLIA